MLMNPFQLFRYLLFYILNFLNKNYDSATTYMIFTSPCVGTRKPCDLCPPACYIPNYRSKNTIQQDIHISISLSFWLYLSNYLFVLWVSNKKVVGRMELFQYLIHNS